MKLNVYKSLWGMSGPLEIQLSRIAAAGYDGVESACVEIVDKQEFRELLKDNQLDYIPLIYTEGDHYASFRRLVDHAAFFAPSKIVAHAGRDTMSFAEQVDFHVFTLEVEQEYGIPVAHETHRRRPLFSPMNALALMKELPDLKLNIDLSHWCCVTESMLDDHEEAVAMAIGRAIHCHARAGYENGPQVPDPRTPEWEAHQGRFEDWWREYLCSQRARLQHCCTVTPEYGPPSYMHTTPTTGQPVADLWEICLWTANRVRLLDATTNT